MNEKARARAAAGSLLHLVLSEVAHERGRPLAASAIADRLVEKGEAVDFAALNPPGVRPNMRDAILLTVIPQALRLGVLVPFSIVDPTARRDGVVLGPAGWTLVEAALVEKGHALAVESSS